MKKIVKYEQEMAVKANQFIEHGITENVATGWVMEDISIRYEKTILPKLIKRYEMEIRICKSMGEDDTKAKLMLELFTYRMNDLKDITAGYITI